MMGRYSEQLRGIFLSSSVNLDRLLVELQVVDEEGLNLDTLIALELNDLSEFFVFDECSVTGEFLENRRSTACQSSAKSSSGLDRPSNRENQANLLESFENLLEIVF